MYCSLMSRVVGGVVVPPPAGPGLDPGVALARRRCRPTTALRVGMQIARHVSSRNSHAAQQNQRQVREVLADALALAQRVQPRRVHAGGARDVLEFAVHPVRAAATTASCGSWYLAIRLPDPRDPLARRRVVGAVEHLVVPVDHRLGLQVLPGDLLVGRLALVGLHHRRRGHLSSVCGACRSNAVTAVPQ